MAGVSCLLQKQLWKGEGRIQRLTESNREARSSRQIPLKSGRGEDYL